MIPLPDNYHAGQETKSTHSSTLPLGLSYTQALMDYASIILRIIGRKKNRELLGKKVVIKKE